jgi:hypothetical protein
MRILYNTSLLTELFYIVYFIIYNKGLQCNYIVDMEALQFSGLICVPEDGSGEPKHVVQ